MKFKPQDITIRKNSMSTIETTVLPWQVPLLKEVFGDENVQVNKDSNHPPQEVEIEAEYERLCSCFGQELVNQVYGHNPQRLLKDIESYAVKDEPKAKG
jgi:hypothetical protein